MVRDRAVYVIFVLGRRATYGALRCVALRACLYQFWLTRSWITRYVCCVALRRLTRLLVSGGDVFGHHFMVSCVSNYPILLEVKACHFVRLVLIVDSRQLFRKGI